MLRVGMVAFALAVMVVPVLAAEETPLYGCLRVSANAMTDEALAAVEG